MEAWPRVRVPAAYMVAAVAQPEALAKKAEMRTAKASPGRPNRPMTGAKTVPSRSIRPVAWRMYTRV